MVHVGGGLTSAILCELFLHLFISPVLCGRDTLVICVYVGGIW